MNKIWKIKGQTEDLAYTDSELITLISSGELNGETILVNSGLKQEVKIKDTIYSYYLKEENNYEKTNQN